MKSPHHQTAFSIITRHSNVLLDDEPLDDLIEDIASALQDVFDLGFKGLIDHPLTPLIVAWLEAVNRRTAYFSTINIAAEKVARDLLNAALEELK
jgi:hypothetical protein